MCKTVLNHEVKEKCQYDTYVRFRSRASLGIIGDGAPSLSQCVGFDR